MEKSRMRPVPAGKSVRMSFSRQKEVLEMPNLIEIQKDSYQWFLDEGLKEVFDDISPIADFAGHLSLEFVDFTLCKDDIKYTIEECKERDATYAAPLKVKVRLCNSEERKKRKRQSARTLRSTRLIMSPCWNPHIWIRTMQKRSARRSISSPETSMRRI